MKNLLWVVVAVVVLVGGYMLFTGKSLDDMKAMVTGSATDATDAADDDATAVTETAEEAADTATEAASDAATATEEAAEEAADTATEAASDAATATEEAAEEAADTAAEAASDAATATEEAAEEATESTDAAADTATTVTEDAGEALTVDGFDFEKVNEMIAASDLGEVQKTMLTEGLKQAQDNPELLSQALDQVKQALGM